MIRRLEREFQTQLRKVNHIIKSPRSWECEVVEAEACAEVIGVALKDLRSRRLEVRG